MNQIIFVEPQCCNYQHLEVNAALINQKYSLTKGKVLIAETAHLAALSEWVNRVRTQIPINQMPRGMLAKCLHMWAVVRKILANSTAADTIVILSASTVQMMFVPVLCLWRPNVQIYHHGLVENLISPAPLKKGAFRLLFGFLGRTKNLTNIFLGEHIQNTFTQHRLEYDNYFFTRLPFATRTSQAVSLGDSPASAPVITIGQQSIQKGFEDTWWIIQRLREKNILCEVVGFANSEVQEYLRERYPESVLGSEMLSPSEMRRRISRAQSVFFTYPSNTYRVSSSGAYYDAVAADRVVFAYRSNEFFRCESRYYDKLTLVDDREQMLAAILDSSLHSIPNI